LASGLKSVEVKKNEQTAKSKEKHSIWGFVFIEDKDTFSRETIF
jgi:hypothetical protein|tara:strand:- start:480 stop:611 length:132 start_codon:yes stop_codon:yes gene_type:complete